MAFITKHCKTLIYKAVDDLHLLYAVNCKSPCYLSKYGKLRNIRTIIDQAITSLSSFLLDTVIQPHSSIFRPASVLCGTKVITDKIKIRGDQHHRDGRAKLEEIRLRRIEGFTE